MQEYTDQGNLSDWLLEPDAADQFRWRILLAAAEMLPSLLSRQILRTVQFYVLFFICTPDSFTIHFFLVVILFWLTSLTYLQ